MKDLEFYKTHINDLHIADLSEREQETVIVIPREGTVRVTTTNPTMLTKLKRVLSSERTRWRLMDICVPRNASDDYHVTEVSVESDEDLITIRAARRTAELTDEQREQASVRMKAWHEGRKEQG